MLEGHSLVASESSRRAPGCPGRKGRLTCSAQLGWLGLVAVFGLVRGLEAERGLMTWISQKTFEEFGMLATFHLPFVESSPNASLKIYCLDWVS